MDLLETTSVEVLGISTVLENYQLAYKLNAHLGWYLQKAPKPLELSRKKENIAFERYEFDWEEEFVQIELLNNKLIQKEESTENTLALFDLGEPVKLHYLCPSFKKVDFVLKFEGLTTRENLEEIQSKIKSIDQVQTCFGLEKTKLNNTEFLIH
jgi:hypothetical protein